MHREEQQQVKKNIEERIYLMGVPGRLSRWLLVLCVCACGVLGGGAAAQAAAPTIEEEWAADVTLDGAKLQATLDPQGSATTYRFEYGTSLAYGSNAPVPEADAGSSSGAVTVAAHVDGLTAGTAYHYRLVATSGAETVDGSDHTFTTFTPTSGVVPDGRQYELVSPPDKNGGEIDGGAFQSPAAPPREASEEGNAIMYQSSTGFESTADEAKGSTSLSSYLSKRGPDGWTTENVTPPTDTNGAINATSRQVDSWEALAPDLSAGFLVAGSTLLPGSFAGFTMPYLRDNANGAYKALSPIAPPNREAGDHDGETPGVFIPYFAGASRDFSHIAFSANDALAPNAIDTPNETERNLYEWSNGQLRLVNVLPDGSVLPPSSIPVFGSEYGQGLEAGPGGGAYNHVVSADGSRVFWVDALDRELFARVNGTSTILASGSQKTNGSGPGGADPLGPQPPVYQDASADGSQVLFTSKAELTDDANTGAAAGCGDCGRDLYRYSMDTGRLTDLTADSSDPEGASVQGAAVASEDGSYVYFVAGGVLAPGAAPASCQPDRESGFCNLYEWHEGAGTHFIARITGEEAVITMTEDAKGRVSRVSPSGRFFAFESLQRLTGYDNTLADGTVCSLFESFRLNRTRDCTEVFLYDAQTHSLVCASCNPTGARPAGRSILPGVVGGSLGNPLEQGTANGAVTPFYQQRYLSDDGRLFFDTLDALSPRDTNGQVDVYEYENGEAHLITGGFGAESSVFIDASASGDDVFFATRDQLASADQDEAVDLYDARVGGLPNIARPPACSSSDACKPGPTPQPAVFGAPASATFSGAGNVVAAAPVKAAKRGRAQRHRKRKPRVKHRKATRTKARRATAPSTRTSKGGGR
jgi:hypothetical protein